MKIQLEGSFSEKPLYRILKNIVDKKITGVLSLSGENDTVVLMFELGMCVGAESYYAQPEYKIGKLMVLRGWLTEEQLKNLLEKQKKSMKKIGYLAKEENLVSVPQLMEVLEDQVLLIVFSCLTWRRGLYHIQLKDDVIYDKDSFRPVDLSEIVRLGEEILKEQDWVEERIPDLSVVPQLIPDRQVVPLGVQVKETGVNAPVVLEKHQEIVYSYINSILSVKELMHACHQFPWFTLKAVIELEDAGIIELPQIKIKSTSRIEKIKLYFPAIQSLKYGPYWASVVFIVLIVAISIPMMIFPEIPSQGKLWFNNLISRHKMDRIRFALNVYRIVNKHYPQYLSELNEADYLKREDILDAWNQKFFYKPLKNGYTLISSGKDGNWATDDDIIMKGESDEAFNGSFFSQWVQ